LLEMSGNPAWQALGRVSPHSLRQPKTALRTRGHCSLAYSQLATTQAYQRARRRVISYFGCSEEGHTASVSYALAEAFDEGRDGFGVFPSPPNSHQRSLRFFGSEVHLPLEASPVPRHQTLEKDRFRMPAGEFVRALAGPLGSVLTNPL
jgi:hypothetical protein